MNGLPQKAKALAHRINGKEKVPPMRQRFLRVNRPLELWRKRIVLFDLNKTITQDALFYDSLTAACINSIGRAIEDDAEVGKFLQSVARLKSPECLYRPGRFLLKNGWVYDPQESRVYAPDHRVLPSSSLPRHMFEPSMTMPDSLVMLRGLAMRRGFNLQESLKHTTEPIKEVVRAPPVDADFNGSIYEFISKYRGMLRFIVVTDNQEPIANHLLEMMGIRGEFAEVIADQRKSHSFSRALLYIMNRYRVSPSQLLMIGDSYTSDVRPLIPFGVPTINITWAPKKYPGGEEPWVVASSLNLALQYLDSTISHFNPKPRTVQV